MKTLLAALLVMDALSGVVYARMRQLAQPVSVRADSIQVDERTGLSTYRGHVRIVQNGITVRADVVRVHSVHGQVIWIRAHGAPLHMEDQETRGLPLFGTARTMDFEAGPDEVTLTGGVIFRQGVNVLHGHIVHYYVRSQRITAARGRQRVRARIVPRTHKPPARPRP